MRQQTMLGLQVLRRAHDFLAANPTPGTFGAVSKQVEGLGQSVDRLAAHAVDQDESDRAYRGSANGAQQQARLLRGNFMRPVARTAKSIFPDDAALRRSLALPKERGYEHLIAAAGAMAGRAEEHKDRFVEAGFSDDFVERLRKAASDLRAALDAKGTHFGKRSAATAGMRQELARGRDLVRVLDDMVRPALQATPIRLAEWRTLSRFIRSAKAVEQATPVPPVGTPNVVPAGTPAAPVVVTLPVATTPQGSTALDRAA